MLHGMEYLYTKTKPNVDKYSSPMRHIWGPKKRSRFPPRFPQFDRWKLLGKLQTLNWSSLGKQKKRFEGPRTPRILLGKDGPVSRIQKAPLAGKKLPPNLLPHKPWERQKGRRQIWKFGPTTWMNKGHKTPQAVENDPLSKYRSTRCKTGFLGCHDMLEIAICAKQSVSSRRFPHRAAVRTKHHSWMITVKLEWNGIDNQTARCESQEFTTPDLRSCKTFVLENIEVFFLQNYPSANGNSLLRLHLQFVVYTCQRATDPSARRQKLKPQQPASSKCPFDSSNGGHLTLEKVTFYSQMGHSEEPGNDSSSTLFDVRGWFW